MALRIYELPTSSTPITKPVSPIRVVARAHDAPVYVCKTDPTSTYLASGAADGTVKVWDIVRGFPTHVLRGHGGVVSAIAWSYPRAVELEVRKMRLFTASVDTRIRVWDLTQGAEQARVGKQVKPEAVLEGHVSVPRGLDVSEDGRWLVSGGRDQVALIWDMVEKPLKKSGKGKAKQTWPVLANTITALERVEAVGILGDEVDIGESSSRPQHLRFFTAGEKGLVRIWDGKTGHVIRAFGEEQPVNPGDQEAQGQILDALWVVLGHLIASPLTSHVVVLSRHRPPSSPSTLTRISFFTLSLTEQYNVSLLASMTRSLTLRYWVLRSPPSMSLLQPTLPSYVFIQPNLLTRGYSPGTAT
jgi:U3 small nucleolar RNA-associated protein 13